ncbi:MAG: multidrug ABC transporter ATP-binding protein [Syntrophus sp. (in: bacteria)]|nr:multidrug ABC transporter ATP-binding protein [Syntrophus sp. (in: bacteria)]
MNDRPSIFARLRQQAPYIPKTMRLVWRASGIWMVAWLMLLLVQGALPVAIVYMTRHVVDTLAGIVGKGGMGDSIVFPLVILGLLLLAEQILLSTGQWVRTIQNNRIQDYMSGLIHVQVMAVDLSFYDSSVYYDRLHRARMDAMTRPLALLDGMGSLCQNAITLAGMAALLFSYSFWIPILLFAGTAPALWATVRYAGQLNEWWRRNTVEERRCEYYDWLLTMRDAAQELRFFDLGAHYRSVYQQLRARLRNEKERLEKGRFLTELGASALALLTTALAMLWMIFRTIAGKAGVGDIVLFYQAFGQGQRLMANLLRNTGEIYQNVLFLENLFELLETKPKICDPENPLPVPDLNEELRFANIEFRYPGSERTILQEFNLTMKAGEIAAIVGENGEGKSTLIKLLCRFYDPDKGRITVDGCDIRELSQAEWRGQITVLFQEPVRYHVSASENIAHGDIAGNPTQEGIEKAAEASGAFDIIERLPEGFQTVLGKWFGGAELSAGEWQRVALARAFLRRARLIILDEPTSMLDAWSEARWFSRFRTLAAGSTVLIISHRLTTTMQADVIHVMQGGRITESGSHEELLNRHGRYSEAWESRKALSVL